jgi:hypothetical protein
LVVIEKRERGHQPGDRLADLVPQDRTDPEILEKLPVFLRIMSCAAPCPGAESRRLAGSPGQAKRVCAACAPATISGLASAAGAGMQEESHVPDQRLFAVVVPALLGGPTPARPGSAGLYRRAARLPSDVWSRRHGPLTRAIANKLGSRQDYVESCALAYGRRVKRAKTPAITEDVTRTAI